MDVEQIIGSSFVCAIIGWFIGAAINLAICSDSAIEPWKILFIGGAIFGAALGLIESLPA